MFKGRSSESKKLLYKSIIDNLTENPGISGDDIIIVVYDPPLENWGVKGGKPANEVNFGFDIKV